MPRRDAELKARLLATFQVEAAEHLASLLEHLLALGAGPEEGEAQALLETTFREMHTLKGAARSVGLRDIERVCAAGESLLSTLTRARTLPTPALLALLEETVDAVGRLVSAGGGAAPGDLLERLARATDDPAAVAPATAPRAPEPAAAAAPARPGTIRLATTDLDALLRRGEDLLAVKLAAGER